MQIVPPDPRFHASFLQAWDEFDAELGLEPGADLDDDAAGWMGAFGFRRAQCQTPEGFAEMCRTRRQAETVAAPGFVTSTLLWAVEDDQWLGRVSVRHELTDRLRAKGGHIGYAVRPSARRRGIATALARAGLQLLAGRGLAQALITCDDDNLASIGTIEKLGGVLQDVAGGTRRYWVPTA